MEAAESIWQAAINYAGEGEVQRRLQLARTMPDATAEEAARALGNGTEISAQDTVPFCIWNTCRCLSDYREAIISTIEVGGDCDTNCAIVGGIITSYATSAAIPAEWLRVRERLDIRR